MPRAAAVAARIPRLRLSHHHASGDVPGAREVGAREVGAREVGAREVGVREVGARSFPAARRPPLLVLGEDGRKLGCGNGSHRVVSFAAVRSHMGPLLSVACRRHRAAPAAREGTFAAHGHRPRSNSPTFAPSTSTCPRASSRSVSTLTTRLDRSRRAARAVASSSAWLTRRDTRRSSAPLGGMSMSYARALAASLVVGVVKVQPLSTQAPAATLRGSAEGAACERTHGVATSPVRPTPLGVQRRCEAVPGVFALPWIMTYTLRTPVSRIIALTRCT